MGCRIHPLVGKETHYDYTVYYSRLYILVDSCRLRKYCNFEKGNHFDSLANAGNELTIKPGGLIGGLFKINITKYFKIQPEIFLSTKGVIINCHDDDYEWKIKYNFIYGEIPLLFRLDIPIKNRAFPYVMSGPAIGFRCLALETYEEEGEIEPDIYYEGTELLDIGIVFSGGIDIRTGKRNIGLEFRYSLGLLNIGRPIEWEEWGQDVNGNDILIQHRDDKGVWKNGAFSIILNTGSMFD